LWIAKPVPPDVSWYAVLTENRNSFTESSDAEG